MIRAPAPPRLFADPITQAYDLPASDKEAQAERKMLRRMDIAEAVRR